MEEEIVELEEREIVPFVFHDIDEERRIIENFKVLLKSQLESASDEIQNAFIELESPNNSITINAIDFILSWAIKRKDDISILQSICKIFAFYDNLPYMILENRAARYFIDAFGLSGPQQVAFREKTVGAQAGRIILITIPSSKTKTFYIKTHRGGSKSDTDDIIELKPVDPKELLVYSALQYLQIGPEVHYFWEDSINFYIATADLKEIGTFTEYNKIYKTLPDPEITPALDPIHFQICSEITKLGLLQQIFRLSDALINKSNFGFVEKNGSQALYLIDFL